MFETNISEYAIGQMSQLGAQDLSSFLEILSYDIDRYLLQYELAVIPYLQETGMSRSIEDFKREKMILQDNDQWKSIGEQKEKDLTMQLSVQSKMARSSILETNALITLEQGYKLLNRIRTVFTGQQIRTNITMQFKGKMYVIDAAHLPLTTVFSTYGGNQYNPISLAYTISTDIKELEAILVSKGEEISSSSLYNTIFNLKPKYLETKALEKYNTTHWQKYYKPVFNSKDAEIYDLYSQVERNKRLTQNKYRDLRKSLGSGSTTSWLQEGDIGLIQDKYFSSKSNTVNYAKISTIKSAFEQLRDVLSPKRGTMNMASIQSKLNEIFIGSHKKNIDRDLDRITEQTRNEAVSYLNSIFTNKQIKIF